MTAAWIAGASGLVGGELLRDLLDDDLFDKVVSVGRRTLPVESTRLVQAVVDFSDPRSFEPLDEPQVAFCAIGTTMKKAGSREAFRAVDYDAVLTYAKAARAKGARTFLHVSWLLANPHAWSFYSRVKGEVELAVAKLGFESVYAFRPSFLDGERKEPRPLEHAALVVGRLVGPLLGKFRPTPVSAVAKAMVEAAKHPEPGAHVVPADEIEAYAHVTATELRTRHA